MPCWHTIAHTLQASCLSVQPSLQLAFFPITHWGTGQNAILKGASFALAVGHQERVFTEADGLGVHQAFFFLLLSLLWGGGILCGWLLGEDAGWREHCAHRGGHGGHADGFGGVVCGADHPGLEGQGIYGGNALQTSLHWDGSREQGRGLRGERGQKAKEQGTGENPKEKGKGNDKIEKIDMRQQ